MHLLIMPITHFWFSLYSAGRVYFLSNDTTLNDTSIASIKQKPSKYTMSNRYRSTFKLLSTENLHLVACEDADPGKHCEENLSLFRCSL